MDRNGEILIVGAGVAGLATALALHRVGVKSIILESSSSLRVSGYGVLIWANAWRALDALGVGHRLREQHLLLQEVQTFSTVSGIATSRMPLLMEIPPNYGGNPTLYSGNNEVRCLIRKVLLQTLANELPQGTIKYSSKVVHIEELGDLKLVHLTDGSVVKATVLIGCDGVNSVVAKWLKLSKPVHTQRAAARGIADFPGGHGLEPKMFRHYGNGIRHGFVPCDDKSIYWFMTFMSSEHMDKEMENNPEKVKKFVLDNIGNVPTMSKTVIDKTELNNISVVPLKMRWPWDMLLKNISKDNVCVAGDALHPMTPEIGQGGCSALEDAIVLARCLGQALSERPDGKTGQDEGDMHRSVKDGLEKFANERKWRSFILITTAYLVGKIQQSSGSLMRFLRDKIFSGVVIQAQLRLAAFDCGEISHI